MNTTQCRRAGRAAMSHGCTTRFPLVACTAAMALCPTALGQNEGTMGRWDRPPLCDPADEPYEWPHRAFHAIHLPSNEVLYWQMAGTTSKVWSASTGCWTGVSTSEELRCSAPAALANGSIVVAGGRDLNLPHNSGIDQVLIYRLGGVFGGPWDTDVAQLNHARWYPTCTTLPDGKILAISGRDQNQDLVDIPEIYDPVDPDNWADMNSATAAKTMPVYPFMFVLPDGNVFYAGSHGGGQYNDGETYILDLVNEDWSSAGSTFIARWGSAVMYEPGRVLKCGGENLTSGLPVNNTETIDLSDPLNPGSWQIENLLGTPRRLHNLVLLADGTILAVGGETDEGNGPVAVFEAELFDPNEAFPEWVEMASMEKERREHSTALLLPDATVLAAGHPLNPFATAEIYSPKYLYKAGGGDADRPEIGVAPTDVTYGSLFNVILTSTSPVSVNAIDKVTFVRLGSTTHGFDMGQRFMQLAFVVTGTATLEVTAPADGGFAPPGYYMLFLISDDGAPSEMAKYVRLYDPA